MADRDLRQTGEARVAERVVLAAHHLARRRARLLAERRVDVGQQADVGRGVATLEGTHRHPAAAVRHPAGVEKLAHETRQLRPRQAGRLGQEALHQALVVLSEVGVLEPRAHPLDETVRLLARVGLEIHRSVALKEGAHLLQRV